MSAPRARLRDASLPARVLLPSGRWVRLSDAKARSAAAAGAAHGRAGIFRQEFGVLRADGVLRQDGGQPLDPLELALRDVHALRALLFHASVLEEEPGQFGCSHCDAPFEVAPSRLLEIGPFRDGELRDPELDAPFAFERDHAIPALVVGGVDPGREPRRTGARRVRTVRLAERTAAQVLPLWRAAERRELKLTPAVVAAMGVVALGRERRAGPIADALASAPDASWNALVDLWYEAHYSYRLLAEHRCAACGARTDLEVPLMREIAPAPEDDIATEEGREPRRPRRARRAGEFPDLDAFEAKVRAVAARVYRARRVRNVDLFIDAGVAACDDGGEPLLGCYTPGRIDGEVGPERPEVRIFYRTFRSEFHEDPGFDLDHEIEETIDHELTHHLHHVAGSDPLDDEEHGEIEAERTRRVGRRETVRRAARGFGDDLRDFVRYTWPVWLLACGATALTWCT